MCQSHVEAGETTNMAADLAIGQVIHGSLHIDSLICYLLYLVYHYISYVYPAIECIQDYIHPDDETLQSTIEMTPRFKPFTYYAFCSPKL